jgi:ribosomal protein L37E
LWYNGKNNGEKEVNPMVCNNCGRNTQNEEANFCEYCGSSYRERGTFHATMHNQLQSQRNDQASGQMSGPIPGQVPNSMSMQMPNIMTGQRSIESVKAEKPITFLNWLGVYGILIGSLFIPFIGFLIPIVMLFVWSFNSSTPVSKRNWARVNLIVIAFFIIFYIIIFMAFMRTPMFQQILNGTFDMNSYFNNLSGTLN